MNILEYILSLLPLSRSAMERLEREQREQILKQFSNQEERLAAVENVVKSLLEVENRHWEMTDRALDSVRKDILASECAVAEARKEIEKTIGQSEKKVERILHRRADRLEAMRIRQTPRVQLSFEVALAEHCNLRCAGCDHFSPIAQPKYADLEEFSRNFNRLSELFYGQAHEIRLLGGEPLLHPEIPDFLTIARRYFPQAVIYIVTNGLLLPKMSEIFWESCRENEIVIQPTKYPINMNYDAVETLASQHGVNYEFFGDTRETLKTLNKYPIDLTGRQDPRRSFLLCYRANQCIYLQNGRLYPCTTAPTAHHLNHRFGLALTENINDSINIYSAKSSEDILRFLADPIPFCRYCMPEKTVYGMKWRTSEEKLSEWTL